MRVLLTIALSILSLSSFADLVNEELIAQKGILCLKGQYSVIDTKALESISDKVTCKQAVEITSTNKLSNLDCPDQPIFNSFLNTQQKFQRKSSCLLKERNESPGIFENINCDCVEESLKAEYKGDLEKKTAEFREELKNKIEKNIGERFRKKIETIKNNQILLTVNGQNARSCLQSAMFRNRFLRLTKQNGCSENSEVAINRIKNMFGDSLDIDTKEESLDYSLDQLIKGIQNKASIKEGNIQSENSCFQNSKEMEEKYIRMKYNDRLVNLKASFGDFIKNRNLYAPNIREEFNSYVSEKGMDLHPLIKMIARDNLSEFLKTIDNDRSGKALTLNDLLTGENNKKWMKNIAMSSRVECISTANELAEAICTDAELSYDDPVLIETFLNNDQEYKNENLLDLKNLYCKKKDLHTIDDNGALLVYKNRLNTNLDPGHIMDEEFEIVLKNTMNKLNSNDPEGALQTLTESLLKSKDAIVPLSRNNELIAKIEEAKKIIGIATINLFDEKKKSGKAVKKSEYKGYKGFFQGLDSIKSILLKKQEYNIQKIANEVYDIKKPAKKREEFREDFLQNFKDRRYSRNLTNNLDSHNPIELSDNSEVECQSGFTDVYCSLKETFKDSVDMNCMEEIGTIATIEALNRENPNNNYQNICESGKNKTSVSIDDFTSLIKAKIESRPGICKELDKNDYRRTYADIDTDSNMASTYLEVQTGKVTTIFNQDDEVMTYETPHVSEVKTTDINNNEKIVQDSISSPKVLSPSQKENSNFFSDFNFFRDTNKNKETTEETEKIEDNKNRQTKEKSNEDLLDYISKLEDMIKDKESDIEDISTKGEISSNLNPELEKLKKELEDLKSKSTIVKEQIENVESQPSIAAKNSKSYNSNPFTNLKSQNIQSKNIPESKYEELENTDSFSSNQSASSSGLQPNNSIRLDNLSSNNNLSLNEQFDEIVSNASNNGEIEIVFNNETFKLEVKEDDTGEMVCKFADEELNEKRPEELDEICSNYIDSLNRLKASRALASEKEKKTIPKPTPEPVQKRKIFKVQDLNKVLNN